MYLYTFLTTYPIGKQVCSLIVICYLETSAQRVNAVVNISYVVVQQIQFGAQLCLMHRCVWFGNCGFDTQIQYTCIVDDTCLSETLVETNANFLRHCFIH